jgi:hypothetical protein
VQAADRGAQVVTRTVIRGRRSRDEESSFEVKCVVATAWLDTEQRHALGAAQLLVLPDDFAHGGNSRETLLVVCFITLTAALRQLRYFTFHHFSLIPSSAGRGDSRYLKLLCFHDPLVALATCGQGR